MGKSGCTFAGDLDDSKFNEPIPWIGLYVTAASAACAIAMAIDAFQGILHRRFWFPCRWLSINATTLTLITVATKLSVDLNASMPRKQDQLAKLSSTVFICTVMANSMPSLGNMKTKELVTNLMALGIFVVTVILNICIQLSTGVIYVFWTEHVLTMCLLVVLLALMLSSALTIPATKNYCKPQFVMVRLATCTASGAFSLLSAIILAEAMLHSYLMPSNLKFCAGQPDYKWSTTLILITQMIGVGVGTLAPTSRWFTAIIFNCPKKANNACKFKFKVEDYWIRELNQFKQNPLFLRSPGPHRRKLAHCVNNQFWRLCISLQIVVVFICKLFQLISIFFVIWWFISFQTFKKVTRLLKCNNGVPGHDLESNSQAGIKQDLSHYVMLLEEETELIDLLIERKTDATSHWIRMGQKIRPKHLIQLLEKQPTSQEFEGVRKFDSDMVPALDTEEPPNCWALPVVTLTSIAIAIPAADNHLTTQLRHSVHEALVYIRIIEEN